MRLPPSFYEDLKNRINISDVVRKKVPLARKSGGYFGLCPFHEEKTPSFSVNDARKFYHCFGCGAHGDIVTFVAETSGFSASQAAIKLAEDYGIEIPKLNKKQAEYYEEADEVSKILALASGFFKSNLTSRTIDYLSARGVTESAIQEFELGFAPSGKLQQYFEAKSIPLMNLYKAGLVGKREDGRIYEIFHERIIFPIKNIYNRVVGFGGRVLGSSLPKYINSPETIVFKKGETLYGENTAIGSVYKSNYAILVEGYLDVIALHQAGFPEAMASLGTAVTEMHLQKLWRTAEEIILCLDADTAGRRATGKVIDLALPYLQHNKRISFINVPQGEDPDGVLRKYGADYFKQLLGARVSLSEKIWELEYTGKVFDTPEAKADLERKLIGYSSGVKDDSLRNNYQRFFKDKIWQNLFNRKAPAKVKPAPVAAQNFTEIEFLEHAICSIITKFPELLKNEEAYDFLIRINFVSNKLNEFKGWLLENVNVGEKWSAENIRAIAEKSRFFDLFLLLSRPDNLFFDTSLNKDTDYLLIWDLLYKKYHLALLKQEYAEVLQSNAEDAFEKAGIYREEMLNLLKELQKLGEFVTTKDFPHK